MPGSPPGMVERHNRVPRARCALDLFREDGAYTSLASAVSMLVVLALAFSATTAAWTMARAGDAQVAADATSLAGVNVVSSYHTAATVVDAGILSLGLTGFTVTGAGLVGLLVPGASAAAAEAVDAGLRILETRNKFAASASRGLKRLEESLPYLIAANASRTCAAQGAGMVSYTGTAIAAPWESASEFPAIDGPAVPTEGLERRADELGEVAADLARAREETAAVKERAWLADCGRAGMNMQERAARLSGISAVENPDYASSLTWEPQVALDRACAYYRWRRDNDRTEGAGVEARADAAARHAFYRYATRTLESASVVERDGVLVCKVPLLPKNTGEVKGTELYTEVAWPTSTESEGITLHFDASCPGATGAAGPIVSLSALDAGSVRECSVCRFGVGDVGKVPAASTSIDNGFEYHLREFTEALKDYESARNRELELERQARGGAERAGDAFEEALSVLAAKRPRIAPPGRYGCVALVVSGEASTPEELENSFSAGVKLDRRGAISAATLASDAATRENNVLSRFFSGLKERTGDSTVVGIVGNAMDLWGDLLMGYGDVASRLDEVMDGLLGGLTSLGAGPVATWLGERVRGSLAAVGFEPVDLSSRKPVLTDSSNVISAAGMTVLADAQGALRSLSVETMDPEALLQALGYEVGERLAETEFTIAEIPLPGGGSIPLKVRLRDLVGAREGGS